MKVWKAIIGPLLAVGLLASACGSTANLHTASLQEIPVTRGDLILKVNGNGKIAVATDANLSFGSGGKLELLNVHEGDKVTQGQVLAKLDTSGLEVQLAQSKVALDQAKLGQTQAESSLAATQFALDAAQAVADIKDDMTQLQNQIDITQANLDQAHAMNDTAATTSLSRNLTSYNYQLLQNQKKLADLLSEHQYTDEHTASGTSLKDYYLFIGGQQYDRLMVEDLRMKEKAVEAAQETVDKVKDGITQAQKSMDYIQKQIYDATITAPFDGTVARLIAKQGDIIPSPTVSPQVIIYLVDTHNMESDVAVDEMNLASIQIGQDAVISLDALPGKTINGNVTAIATVPNAQPSTTGSSTYTVKIGFTIPPGMDIKAGMNTSVDIVTAIHKNSLLVPDQAIEKDSQGQEYVKVKNSEQVKPQMVTTGWSDGNYTEILSGLNEGDKVVIDNADRWSLPSK